MAFVALELFGLKCSRIDVCTWGIFLWTISLYFYMRSLHFADRERLCRTCKCRCFEVRCVDEFSGSRNVSFASRLDMTFSAFLYNFE